jgi:hypothetical protein
MKDSNQTLGSDLPIELQFNMGVNKAPVTIVCCLLAPEVLTLSAFMFLCWQLLLVYSQAYPKDMLKSMFIRTGDQIIYLIMSIFLVCSLILFGLYVGNVLSAGVISLLFMTVDLVAPTIAITMIIYYQCKLSSIPQSQSGAKRVKFTTIAVAVWSVARLMQFFNTIYFSKQMLEIVRCWQTHDSNVFLSMSLVAIYFLIELVPIYLVMDTSFMSVITNERNLDLSHSSTQPLFEKEHYYNPNVAGSLSSPSINQLEFRSRNLGNNNLESAESSRVLTFDALNLREGVSLL